MTKESKKEGFRLFKVLLHLEASEDPENTIALALQDVCAYL